MLGNLRASLRAARPLTVVDSAFPIGDYQPDNPLSYPALLADTQRATLYPPVGRFDLLPFGVYVATRQEPTTPQGVEAFSGALQREL